MKNIDIKTVLESYKNSLCKKIDLASLHSRSEIAHKWKLTYRLIVTREAIFWRVVDILTQAYDIGIKDMVVGSRILTRSALETVCLLLYMNKKMKSVVEGKISFNDFENITARLLLGARNIDKMPEPINVMTLIEDSEGKYPGIKKIYDDLSETAHPNYSGVCVGYTKLNQQEYETEFGIFWKERYGKQHEIAIEICLKIFENEYNIEWVKWFEQLEKWLEKNDKILERQRKRKR
jgi:hypothetical protein